MAAACVLAIVIDAGAQPPPPQLQAPDLKGSPWFTVPSAPKVNDDLSSYTVVVAKATAVVALSRPPVPRAATMSAGRSRELELADLYDSRGRWVDYCRVQGVRANFENAVMVLTTGSATMRIDVKAKTVYYDGAPDYISISGAVGAVLEECPSALARVEREIAALNGWTYDKQRRWDLQSASRARGLYTGWLRGLTVRAGDADVRVQTQAPSQGSLILPRQTRDPALTMKEWSTTSDAARKCLPSSQIQRKWLQQPVRVGFDKTGKPIYEHVNKIVDIVVDTYPAGCQ